MINNRMYFLRSVDVNNAARGVRLKISVERYRQADASRRSVAVFPLSVSSIHQCITPFERFSANKIGSVAFL